MFGISLPEFLVIVVVALIMLRPKDLPTIGRQYRAFLKHLERFKLYIRSFYDQTHNFLLEQDEHQQSYIKGEDGKYHRAYAVGELSNLAAKTLKKKKSPSKTN